MPGLKTLHLTNAWHATSGGIGTFYRSLLDAANVAGHHLRLVVPSEHDNVEDIGRYGRIYHVKSGHAPVNRSYRFMYPPHYLKPDGRICQILNSERPDLVEICDKYTLPYMGGLLRIKRLKGVDLNVPVIGLSCERMDENMFAYFSRGGFGKWFCRWYMKVIYFPQFDHHIANSEHTAEELRLASRGHKVRRGVWIRPMGVHASCFSPNLRSCDYRESLARRAGGDDRSVLLLYAGRLVPEKNLPLLSETVRELVRRNSADYRLLIAGQGMSRPAFQRACDAVIPGRVLFLDHVSDQSELARLYASCDVFVHPNPREPFGIAPLEGMASGLPLVAPNSGGITSYANASNAWLASAEASAFAGAVEAVGADPSIRHARVARALATAADYDWSAISKDFLKFYQEMVDYFQFQREPAHAAHFYSTLGNYWGREIEAPEFASPTTVTDLSSEKSLKK